jgi:hypothetical protein
VQYDPGVFNRWRKAGEDRLYAREPGEGYIDLFSGAEAEPLESPQPEMHFGGIEDCEDHFEVRLYPDDDPEGEGESILVAAFPKRDIGLDGLESPSPEAES